MCIIVYKPAGVQMPSSGGLRNAFEANPDGAGFMYVRNGAVHVRKGLMTYHDLKDALASAHLRPEEPVVVHMRIATHGAVSPAMCHPFPITSDESMLTAPTVKTRLALAHNGVIAADVGAYKRFGQNSDTYRFVRDIASLYMRKVTWYQDKNLVTLTKRLADSKLAIMGADGHVELIGDFVTEDGIYYSNTSYKEAYYRLVGSSSGSSLSRYYLDDFEDYEPHHRRMVRVSLLDNGTVVTDGVNTALVSDYDTSTAFLAVDEGGVVYELDDSWESGSRLDGYRAYEQTTGTLVTCENGIDSFLIKV
jgi:predicted glutamine amidotransferase